MINTTNINSKPCKKYIDGLCWDNPSWYDTCTYEKCQSACKRYIENDEESVQDEKEKIYD